VEVVARQGQRAQGAEAAGHSVAGILAAGLYDDAREGRSAMATWTSDELDKISAADELEITSARDDGTLRAYVPIWVVRVSEDLYVRSYRGRGAGWFRHVLERHAGRIRAGGIERDVTVAEDGDDVSAAIDEAYRTKYARYGETYVRPITGEDAIAATLRLLPE
jgi:hypothetical protein